MSERTYKSGDTIFDEGEMWPYLGIVKSGKVIYTLLSPDGKTHTIGERLTHDTLNESGTFDGGGATTRAEALTDATIVTLPSEAVIHAARNDAELALGLSDRVVAGAPPFDRHDRRSRVRARAAARREVSCSATRARRSAWRAAFPASKISRKRRSPRPPARCATWRRARCLRLKNARRARTRSRPRARDRPRAARGLRAQRPGPAGLAIRVTILELDR